MPYSLFNSRRIRYEGLRLGNISSFDAQQFMIVKVFEARTSLVRARNSRSLGCKECCQDPMTADFVWSCSSFTPESVFKYLTSHKMLRIAPSMRIVDICHVQFLNILHRLSR